MSEMKRLSAITCLEAKNALDAFIQGRGTPQYFIPALLYIEDEIRLQIKDLGWESHVSFRVETVVRALIAELEPNSLAAREQAGLI